MTVIELGDVSSSSPEYEPPPRRPGFRRPSMTRVLAAAILAGCLLGVTGSARPDPAGPTELWQLASNSDQFTLTEDALFKVTQGRTTTMTSYEPRTGRIQWERDLPQATAVSWFSTESDDLVLVPTYAGMTEEGEPRDPVTQALERDTGEVRWRSAGEVMQALPDTVLLGAWESERIRFLRLVRTRDGATVWEFDDPWTVSGWTAVGPDRQPPTRVVTVADDGRAEVRRFSDGTRVTSGKLPWAGNPPEGDSFSSVFGGDDILFVYLSNEGQQELYAYHVDSLTRLWHVRAGAGFGVYPCGPVLCVNSDLSGVDGIHPRSGEAMWHSQGWDGSTMLPDGRMLGWDRVDSRTYLIDPLTGRTEADLGLINNVHSLPTGELLVLAMTSEPQPRTKLSVLGTDGKLRARSVLGGLEDQTCQLVGTLLACGRPTGGLTVRDLSEIVRAGG